MRQRLLLTLALLALATPAHAHGEQVLAFPCSFVLIVAVIVPVAIWWPGKPSTKLTCSVAVLAVGVASWFAPWVPQTVGKTARFGFVPLLLVLLAPPCLFGGVILIVALMTTSTPTQPPP